MKLSQFKTVDNRSFVNLISKSLYYVYPTAGSYFVSEVVENTWSLHFKNRQLLIHQGSIHFPINQLFADKKKAQHFAARQLRAQAFQLTQG